MRTSDKKLKSDAANVAWEVKMTGFERRALIDYFTATVDNREVLLEMFPPVEKPKPWNRLYELAYETQEGGKVLLNESGHPQGSFLSLGGAALKSINEDGRINDVKWIGQAARGVTRIDLALDIKCEGWSVLYKLLNPAAFYDMYKAGACKTLVRDAQLIQSITLENGQQVPGMTAYFGSPKSNKRLRIYDKAAELRVPDTFWLRLETQHRDRQAAAKFNDCLNNGVAWATKNTLLESYLFQMGKDSENVVDLGTHNGVTWTFKFDCPSAENIFMALIEGIPAEGATGEFEKPGRKETDLDKYLEQIEKALRKRAKKSEQDAEKIAEMIERLYGVIREVKPKQYPKYNEKTGRYSDTN